MKICKLESDRDRYQNLIFASKEDWDILGEFDGRHLLSSWTTPVVEVLRGDKFNRNLPPSDFPSLLPGVPVFSLRAVNVLKEMLTGNGELLPLSCNEGEYHAFNVTTSIDALDESNSKVERFESSGRIMQINKYMFFADRLRDATIFRIPQNRAKIFVTDVFRNVVIDNGLIGFEFVNLWEG
jgi:hypothetical protein